MSGVRSIVVVEDDQATRDLLAVLCQGAGWVVATFESAQEALVWDGLPAVDVLVADHNLGGMTGGDLVARVRLAHPDVYTILTSAAEPPEASRASAHVYIDKVKLAETMTEVLGALRDQ